jgi:hypothetical protein
VDRPARRGRQRPLTDFEITGAALAGAVRVRHSAGRFVPSDDDGIRDISRRIPYGWVDAYDNLAAVDAPPKNATEAVSRLHRIPGVVRLQHMELVPGLRQPLARAIGDGARLLTPGEVVRGWSSVLYIGGATSSADLHADYHHNLFLHLRGTKRFTLSAYSDPRRQQEVTARRFGAHPGLPGVPDEVVTLELQPGDGLYVPPYTLHRVESTDAVTVSIACSWSTDETNRLLALQRANGHLHRLHLRTAPPGRHGAIDRAKLAALPALDRTAALVHRLRKS